MKVESLLSILCCPETHQGLRLIDGARIEFLNAKIKQCQLTNRKGQVIREPIDGALIREDGKVAYPIRKELPTLLVDEAIVL